MTQAIPVPPTSGEAVATHSRLYLAFKSKRNALFGLIPNKPEENAGLASIKQRIVTRRARIFGDLPPEGSRNKAGDDLRAEAEKMQAQYIYMLCIIQTIKEHRGTNDPIDVAASETLAAGRAIMEFAERHLRLFPRQEVTGHVLGELTNIYKFAAAVDAIDAARSLGISVEVFYTFLLVMVLNQLANQTCHIFFVKTWSEEMKRLEQGAWARELAQTNAGKREEEQSKNDGYHFSDDHMDLVISDVPDFYDWVSEARIGFDKACGFGLPPAANNAYAPPVSHAQLAAAGVALRAIVQI
jgi:hypothetical protein